MTTDQYIQKYQDNQQMFAELFNTDYKTIKEGLADLLAVETQILVAKNGEVHKYLVNDEPSKVEIWYYGSCLILTPVGIDFKPEHKEAYKVLYFNPDFKL